MYQQVLIILAAIAAVQAADPLCSNPPAKGTTGGTGGIFGMGGGMGGMGGLPKIGGMGGMPKTGGKGLGGKAMGKGMGKGMGGMPKLGGFPKMGGGGGGASKAGGTGPYPAQYFSDDTLPAHTIYAPKTPIAEELPVLVWGNGACSAVGTGFENLLTEIASHGFLVIANGASNAVFGMSGSSYPKQMSESIDWVYKGANNGKYGKVNKDKIATAGQSCGGLESYSTGYHDERVKFITLFNSGILNPSKTCLLKEFKVPIAYFLGGPKDMAFANGERDYKNLPAGLPALKMSYDSGHMGTYFQPNAGVFGKAAVAYFKWVLKGDEASKKLFLDNPSPWASQGWNIAVKNWK